MKSIVLIGNNKIEEALAQKLQDYFKIIEIKNGDFTQESTYQELPQDLAMVVFLIGPMDVDLAMDAFFSATRKQKIKLKRVVMLSTAGIDNEVNGQLFYPGVNDVSEYLREQRYAIKIIDEEEITYTILRPVNVVEEKQGTVTIINEGNQVPVGNVSCETIVDTIVEILKEDKYQNQSIALIEKTQGD